VKKVLGMEQKLIRELSMKSSDLKKFVEFKIFCDLI
jgi:hypothetical protein